MRYHAFFAPHRTSKAGPMNGMAALARGERFWLLTFADVPSANVGYNKIIRFSFRKTRAVASGQCEKQRD